jgi:PAS domain-containing protein
MAKNASWWEGITHPEDLKRVKHDIQVHFDGKTEFYKNKHRLKTKSGKWKWFFEHGKVIERDELGKPIRMIVTLSDIDKNYRAENAMQISENKFRTIFENAPILIDAFDKDGKCILWNKECEGSWETERLAKMVKRGT